MNASPLVSIVTPSLNQGRFIRETIESVLSQNYPNLEYWIIDGGSTDETLDILSSYQNELRWISEPDGGQSQAINKGWKLTQGEFITWLNADDLLAPQAILHAVQALQDHLDIGGVYGDCDYISKNGTYLKAYPTQIYNYDRLIQETENFIPQPGTFLRREIVNQAGGLDEAYHYVMDHELWLRMGLYAPLRYVPYLMSYARLHEGAKTLQHMDGFANEFVRMYQTLIAHPRYPERLRINGHDILHAAYIHAASFSFWGGETAHARSHLAQAWRHQPFPRRRTFWLLGCFAMLGKPGLKLAEFLHGNPFRVG